MAVRYNGIMLDVAIRTDRGCCYSDRYQRETLGEDESGYRDRHQTTGRDEPAEHGGDGSWRTEDHREVSH